MQRRMVEQDARIAEQMEEIQNLRHQLQLQSEGENGGNVGNPSKVEAKNNQSQTRNDRSSQWDYRENRHPFAAEIQ